MNRWRNCLFLTLCVLGLLILPVYGQKSTGNLSGTVTDPSGAVVANATVTVSNAATGVTRTASTDTQGSFTVSDLAPGMYQVNVKAANFKESVANNVEVHVATTTPLNLKMQLGGATETVEVTTNVVQVQTDSAVLGETIDATQVKELPLNGRNFLGLTQLAPGVSFANNYNARDKGLAGGVDFAVNGNSVTNNLYLVDGANNNDVGSNRTILIYPAVDSIEEFKMLQNSYGPEYGQASGAVITMVTKSGTNQFHGDVFYAGRNDALNSWEWFAKRAAVGNPNATKNKLRRNDYGFSIGGPAIKDRLFFFYSQEWNKEIRGVLREACVPTAAERGGDFSSPSCGASSPTIPVALQAAGNPEALANPTALGLLLVQKFPLPNRTTPVAGTNHNWSASQPSNLQWRQENARVDFNLTKNNRLMGRYTQDNWKNPAPGTTGWGDDVFPVLNSNWEQPSKMIIGKLTSTIGGSIVNDAEFAYSNNRINITPGGSDPGLLAQITAAAPPLYPENLKNTHQGIPYFGWGGFNPYGSTQTFWMQAPWNNTLDIYTVRDDISKVSGNHIFKAGVFMGWDGKNEDANAPTSERINTCPTCIAASSPFPTTGNQLANIMAPGMIFNIGEASTNTRVQLRWRDYEFYGGDTWKVRKNLTLEYGIRYSLLLSPFQPNNQFSSFTPAYYDPTKPANDACNGLAIVPGTDPCGKANQIFGTSFSAGTPSPYGKYLQPQNHHAFAPRLGIAWDPWGDGNWALRAGVGQFFQRDRVGPFYVYANNAPFSLQANNVPRTLDGATFSSASLVPSSASPNGGRTPTTNLPNTWQWNLSVEHSFAKETALQIAYVGNHALHQVNSYDINIPDPTQNFTCTLPGGTFTASTWNCGAFNMGGAYNSMRPFSNFGQLQYWNNNGDATYHAFQTVLKSKYKRSQLTAAYTWSHSIGNVVLDDSSGGPGGQSFLYYKDTTFDRGNTKINRPHIFIANWTVFLPEMKGYNGVVRNVLGGWEFAGITTAQSGHSTTAQQGGISEDTAQVVGTTNGLGNLLGVTLNGMVNPLVTGTSCNAGMKGNQIFNPNAFTLVGAKIGDLNQGGFEPRGYCLGPRFVNTDFSIDKNWKLGERFGMQFRLDLFNLFNHPNFQANDPGGPIQNVNCGPVGAGGKYAPCSPTNNVISRTTLNNAWGQEGGTIGNAARELQYTLKISF